MGCVVDFGEIASSAFRFASVLICAYRDRIALETCPAIAMRTFVQDVLNEEMGRSGLYFRQSPKGNTYRSGATEHTFASNHALCSAKARNSSELMGIVLPALAMVFDLPTVSMRLRKSI